MDENVVFNPQQQSQNPVAPQSPQPQSAQPPPSGTPPVQTPPATPPPPIRRSFFSKGLVFGILGVVMLIILAVFLFRFVFSLIGSNKNEKVTLTYWGLWEDSRVMAPIISDFEKEHPNITINYEKKDSKGYTDRLFTQIQNGTGPDLFRYHNTWVPVLRSILLPLSTDVITPQEFTKIYYPVAQQDLMQNGAIYGIPLEIDTLEMFTNPEILQGVGVSSPPDTWIDFDDAAKKATVPDPTSGSITTSGNAMGTMTNVTHAADILSLLFAVNNTDMKTMTCAGGSKKGSLDCSSSTLQFYTQYTKNADAKTWDASLDPSMKMFASGHLAMYFGYSWDIFAIQALNPDLKFTVSQVPSVLGTRKTIASYWVEGVSSKSKHQKEAELFMQYLTRKETEQKFYTETAKTRAFGEPYARVDLADTLKDNPLVYPFVNQAKNATSSYFISDTSDDSNDNPGINTRMNQYLENAVNSILGNTSVDTAADTLAKGVTQVLTSYGIN